MSEWSIKIDLQNNNTPVQISTPSDTRRPEVVWDFAPYSYIQLKKYLGNVTAELQQDGKIHLLCQPLFDQHNERFNSFSRAKVTIREHTDPVMGVGFIKQINRQIYFKQILSPRGNLSVLQKRTLNCNLMEILKTAKVSFSCMKFPNVDLEGVDLREAILDGAKFPGASLRHAKLGGASLVDTDFHHTDLEGLDISSLELLKQGTVERLVAYTPDCSIVAFESKTNRGTGIKYCPFGSESLLKETLLRTFSRTTCNITALEFLPSTTGEQILFIGLSNGIIGIENIKSGQTIAKKLGFGVSPIVKIHCALSRDFLFIQDADGNRKIIPFNVLNLFSYSHSTDPQAIDVDPKEKSPFLFLPANTDREASYLVVQNKKEVVWKNNRGESLNGSGWILETKEELLFLNYSERGRLILAGTAHSLYVWCLATSERLIKPLINKQHLDIEWACFTNDRNNSIYYYNKIAKCIIEVTIKNEADKIVVKNEENRRIHLDKGRIAHVTPFIEKEAILIHYENGDIVKTQLKALPSSTRPFLRHP
ncbi:MAG: pentapeptide repeat-containing protein, partial [Parachlamydia sp.]|nr:pentapeptide repeat-containing protein [Parachlamydia sp.]